MPPPAGQVTAAIKELGRHGPDALFAALIFVAMLAALGYGVAWWQVILSMAAVGTFYHVRRLGAESHAELACRHEEALIAATRDRYRAVAGPEQR